jgi:hypothetical protein
MKDDEEEGMATGCLIAAAAAFLLAFLVIVELIVRHLNHG